MEYPKRESHFAHRFVRVLHKSCAAQDIGAKACYLLCVIAHTEDAARYRSPARFWNSQLMETLGFTSPKQLDSAREAAVAAGWLQYDRAGTRKVGEYFVTIPAEFEGLSDAAIEPIQAENGTNSGTNSGTNWKRKAERIGNGKRNELETESGKPPIPIPIPIPCPNTLSLTLEDGEFEFTGRWAVPPLVDACRKWVSHITAQGKPFGRIHMEGLLLSHASSGWTAERLQRGIYLSLGKSTATTIIDPDEPKPQRNGKSTRQPQTVDEMYPPLMPPK